ncbi:MAG: lipid II flippase family protein [Dethiobacteria bacterium]
MGAGDPTIGNVLLVCFLTAVIHLVETLSYGARIAGVKTKRLYLAACIFSLVALIARTANLLQAPLLGYYVDSIILMNNIPVLQKSFRLIILSASVGSLAAMLILPTFIHIFIYLIGSLEKSGSLGRMLLNMLNADRLLQRMFVRLGKSLRRPGFYLSFPFQGKKIAKHILLLYIIVASINTVGVLSAIYAGALLPDYRLTASQMSGIINGFSTIVLTFFIDPYASLITDHTLVGKRGFSDLQALVSNLIIGKIIGTLLGQLTFLPCVHFVVFTTTLLKN